MKRNQRTSALPQLGHCISGKIPPRMPFKSKAQRRKFAQLLVEGKIKPETFEEWNRETGGKSLPERAPSKKKAPAASKSSRTSAPRRTGRKSR
jgi:hypothetical protein